MPTYFPQLNAAGLLMQRPSQSSLNYQTMVAEVPGGNRNAFGFRGTGLTGYPTKPLGRWDLNYGALTDAELSVLETFFTQMKGRYGEFTFLDPNGNLVPNSENFADASWSGALASGTGQPDPFGGTRAASTAGGSTSCVVLPGGGATGYVLCMSVWVKAGSAGTATLGLSGAGSTATALPAGSWVRAQHFGVIGSGVISGSIALSVAGTIFGAQCVPMKGPGGYHRTPGNEGLHAKCRFDTDKLSPKYAGPNEISLRVPIVEYW